MSDRDLASGCITIELRSVQRRFRMAGRVFIVADRVDENGAAFAGSQLQTQLYVNRRTAQLDAAIRAAFDDLATATFEWRSPRADENYAEYWDAAFLRCLGLDEHTRALTEFWPKRGGPHWDALALVKLPGDVSTGVLLGEGKSYPNEMLKGSAAGATDPTSTRTIEKALAWTQGRLGIHLNITAWTGPLYQNANRLAHVYWLRSRGVRAWLVYLLFIDDPHRPTNAGDWHRALQQVDRGLGLTGVRVDAAGHVLLPAGPRAELIG